MLQENMCIGELHGTGRAVQASGTVLGIGTCCQGRGLSSQERESFGAPSLQSLPHVGRDGEIDKCVYAEDHANSPRPYTPFLRLCMPSCTCFLHKFMPSSTAFSDGHTMVHCIQHYTHLLEPLAWHEVPIITSLHGHLDAIVRGYRIAGCR
jgi:hypothetical protein